MFKRMINKVLGRNKDKGAESGPDTIPTSVLTRPPSPPSPSQEAAIRDRSRTNSSFSSLIIESSSGSSGVSLELEPDAGGGKGWPTNASVVLYHREQAIIVAGSDSGAVYAYGDGFQYMKAPEDLQDPKAVIFLLSMSEDQVLAVYEDNSMTMLNLPHLTSTGAALPSNWLLQGAISCVRRDDYNKNKMYVYVGTTDGSLFVLDCSLPAQIRECDYVVTLEDVNLVEMSISDIQVHPKEEKYLAIGYNGFESGKGSIIVYDLVKRKIKRGYATSAITSLAWTHTADHLYAGCTTGSVLCGSIDKENVSEVWNAVVEKSDFVDEDEDHQITISIRKLQWLAPQAPSTDGCLFALLGATSGTSSETLKSVIVGLAAVNTHNGGLDQVLSIPPSINGEEIIGFRLVASTYEQYNTPAIMMLTNENDNGDRHLKVVRCPTSALKDWALEIGLLPEPEKISTVFPGTSDVTAMMAMSPQSSITSFSHVLISTSELASIEGEVEQSVKDLRVEDTQTQKDEIERDAAVEVGDGVEKHGEEAEEDGVKTEDKEGGGGDDDDDDDDNDDGEDGSKKSEDETQQETKDVESKGESDALSPSSAPSRASKRMSASNFMKASFRLSFFGMDSIKEATSHNIPLASSNFESEINQHDLVLLGHSDGSVVAWSVVQTKEHQKGCVGSTWLQQRLFSCGTGEVTVITHSNDHGLLAVGDQHGVVTIFEVYETSSNKGAAEYFSTIEKFRGMFRPDGIRRLFQANTGGDSVTSITIIAKDGIVVVGTASGKLFISLDWSSNQLSSSNQLVGSAVGATGSVLCTMYSRYHAADPAIPAVFVLFESGHVVVVDYNMMNLVACAAPPNISGAYGAESVAFSEIVDSNFDSIEIGSSNPSSPSSKDTSSEQSSSEFPVKAPRYLLYIRGQLLFTYDISKFTSINKHSPRSSGSFSAKPEDGWVTARKLADASIVCAHKLTFIEEANRFAEPTQCIASIDNDGCAYLHTFHEKLTICSLQIFEPSFALARGTVLPNGACYVQQGRSMVSVSSLRSDKYILSQTAPLKADIVTTTPDSSLQLSTGVVAKSSATAPKRRMTIMPVSVVDLNKIFSKTRDQREKDELFAKLNAKSEMEEGESSGSKNAANEALSAAAETREALQERGRQLTQINDSSARMSSAASDYRTDMKKHKEALQKKNDRWGIF